MSGEIKEVPLTWAAGESLSNKVELNGSFPLAIDTPGTFAPTSLTFVAVSGAGVETNFTNAAGTEYVITSAASNHILIPPSDAVGSSVGLRVRRGTLAAPATSGALTATMIIRAIN